MASSLRNSRVEVRIKEDRSVEVWINGRISFLAESPGHLTVEVPGFLSIEAETHTVRRTWTSDEWNENAYLESLPSSSGASSPGYMPEDSTETVIEALRARGISLDLIDERIVLTSACGLTEGDLAELIVRKESIRQLLRDAE